MRGEQPAQRAVFSGLGVPSRGLARGAVPGKWAHEEREQGNGLLFASPQAGAGKRGADGSGREGCSAPTVPGPGPGDQGAGTCAGPGRPERRGEDAGRGRQREGLSCGKGPRGNFGQKFVMRSEQVTERQRATHRLKCELGKPGGEKRAHPEPGRHTDRAGLGRRRHPRRGSDRWSSRTPGLGPLWFPGVQAGGAQGARRPHPCPGQEVTWARWTGGHLGPLDRGELAPPGAPSSGLAELARLRGQAWPAVCLGLSASREGAGSCNDGGEPCAGGGAPPG